jgi:hypothetical protein
MYHAALCEGCEQVLDNLLTGIYIIGKGDQRMTVCGDCVMQYRLYGWVIIAQAK